MAKPEIKPIWNSSSFLVYAGGLTVLEAAGGALVYLATQYRGHGQWTAWALLMFVILYAIAYLLRRLERPLAAGIFAFAAVSAWIWLVVVTLIWRGWVHTSPLTHWSWGAIAGLLVILLVAWDARRRFRLPFIRYISVVYFFVFVNVVLPAGGNWTATWAVLVGLLYLLVGTVSDKPSTFWLHLASGALIGGGFLYWFHTSDGDFAFISILSLAFVLLGHATRRSSWAVWGTVGFFIATIHYLLGSPTQLAQGVVGVAQRCSGSLGSAESSCTSYGPHISVWSFPLGFALLGFWLVFLGMLGRRRKHGMHHHHVAVVVDTPAPAAE